MPSQSVTTRIRKTNNLKTEAERHSKACGLCRAIDDAIMSDHGPEPGDCATGARLWAAWDRAARKAP